MIGEGRRPTRRWLTEFVVIVVGVLTALGLEGTWQGIRESRLEAEYMVALIDEAESNLVIARLVIESAEATVQRLRATLSRHHTSEIAGNEVEIANSLRGAAVVSFDYGVSQAVFEDLLSTGNLRLMRDPKFRRDLQLVHAELDALFKRREATTGRVDSGLLNLYHSYEARFGARETDQFDYVGLVTALVADPRFETEVSLEIGRHWMARAYYGFVAQLLEEYVSFLRDGGDSPFASLEG